MLRRRIYLYVEEADDEANKVSRRNKTVFHLIVIGLSTIPA
jgi:hypothetical protein